MFEIGREGEKWRERAGYRRGEERDKYGFKEIEIDIKCQEKISNENRNEKRVNYMFIQCKRSIQKKEKATMNSSTVK